MLLPLATGPAGDGDELYATTQRVDWDTHLGVDGTLAVDFTGTSDTIRDTRYGAVRMKDAIVDQFRDAHGDRRPSVDPRDARPARQRAPRARPRDHLARPQRRQPAPARLPHRPRQVEAPLKENLAAAMLLFAAWPQEAAAGGSLLDPLCGSGTLPIEAAIMAADVAPGAAARRRLGGFAFSLARATTRRPGSGSSAKRASGAWPG